MAHKIGKVLVGVVLAIFLVAPDLFAFPVLGYVDPGFGSGYDLGTTTTGTATYYFENMTTVPAGRAIKIQLAFEGDVFDLAHTAPVIGSQTPGWAFLPTLSLGPFYEIETTVSPLLGIEPGETLSFQVNYTLLDDALSLDSLWDEGGYWQQKWTAKHFLGKDFIVDDGGSTAPIPEPATMLLFGISLLSVAGYGRYRINRG